MATLPLSFNLNNLLHSVRQTPATAYLYTIKYEQLRYLNSCNNIALPQPVNVLVLGYHKTCSSMFSKSSLTSGPAIVFKLRGFTSASSSQPIGFRRALVLLLFCLSHCIELCSVQHSLDQATAYATFAGHSKPLAAAPLQI